MNSAKIIEAICLHGLPPKRQRGALCTPEGYWGIIAKEVSQKQKTSQGYVKCGYKYWQLNIKSVRDRVLQLTEGVIKQNDFIYSIHISF